MYVSRIRRWGFSKNNKKEDMVFVLHKQNKRDALGKATEFVVCGRVIAQEDILTYFSKTKDGVPSQEELDLDVQTPPHISYRTPSPQPLTSKRLVPTWQPVMDSVSQQTYAHVDSLVSSSTFKSRSISSSMLRGSSDGNGSIALSYMKTDDICRLFSSSPEVSPPLSAPFIHKGPQELFISVHTYFTGSILGGTWITNGAGCFHATKPRSENGVTFVDCCRTFMNMVDKGSFTEARKMLSRAFSMIRGLLEDEDPRTLTCICDVLVLLSRRQFRPVVDLLRSYLSEMAAIVIRDNQ